MPINIYRTSQLRPGVVSIAQLMQQKTCEDDNCTVGGNYGDGQIDFEKEGEGSVSTHSQDTSSVTSTPTTSSTSTRTSTGMGDGIYALNGNTSTSGRAISTQSQQEQLFKSIELALEDEHGATVGFISLDIRTLHRHSQGLDNNARRLSMLGHTDDFNDDHGRAGSTGNYGPSSYHDSAGNILQGKEKRRVSIANPSSASQSASTTFEKDNITSNTSNNGSGNTAQVSRRFVYMATADSYCHFFKVDAEGLRAVMEDYRGLSCDIRTRIVAADRNAAESEIAESEGILSHGYMESLHSSPVATPRAAVTGPGMSRSHKSLNNNGTAVGVVPAVPAENCGSCRRGVVSESHANGTNSDIKKNIPESQMKLSLHTLHLHSLCEVNNSFRSVCAEISAATAALRLGGGEHDEGQLVSPRERDKERGKTNNANADDGRSTDNTGNAANAGFGGQNYNNGSSNNKRITGIVMPYDVED